MKKFAVLFLVLSVVAFSGTAFAATGGHVIVNPTPAQPGVGIGTPTSPTTGITITAPRIVAAAPSTFTVSNIVLPASIAAQNNEITVQTVLNLTVAYTTATGPAALVAPLTGFTAPSGTLFVMALRKNVPGGKFEAFPATFTGGNLNFTISPVGEYFSASDLVVVSIKTTDPTTTGGSGGGCSAGLGVLALLALVPFVLRKGRK